MQALRTWLDTLGAWLEPGKGVMDPALAWLRETLGADVITRVVNWLTTIVGVAVLLLVLGVIIREILTYRALAPDRRRRYLVRRTGDVEWNKEDLERWAAQLSMVRRRIREFLDRPAHSIRFRLEATPQGSRYTVESSWRIEKVMRAPALSGVTIARMRPRPPADGPDHAPDAPPSLGDG